MCIRLVANESELIELSLRADEAPGPGLQGSYCIRSPFIIPNHSSITHCDAHTELCVPEI